MDRLLLEVGLWKLWKLKMQTAYAFSGPVIDL
jgi:hypothetical protein